MKLLLSLLVLAVGLSMAPPSHAEDGDIPLIHGARWALGVRSSFVWYEHVGDGTPLFSRQDGWSVGITNSYNLVPNLDLILSTDYHFEQEDARAHFRTYAGVSLLVIDGYKLFWGGP